MGSSYQKGIAFIFEGQTEKVFYSVLLNHLCHKHSGFQLTKNIDSKTGEVFYLLNSETTSVLVMMNTVGTISQITNSGTWFASKCHSAHKDLEWTAVLCYDTDSHLCPVSKFHEGDWDILRKGLKKNKAKTIIDMASNVDIEDTMLLDSDSVFRFLQIPVAPVPSGAKGKSKMKKIFRMKGHGVAYHPGERARPLIESLNFDAIIERSALPFIDLEKECFL